MSTNSAEQGEEHWYNGYKWVTGVRCREVVAIQGRRQHVHQCLRRATRDGFCTQHHPDSIKARREEQLRRWEVKRRQSSSMRLVVAQEKLSRVRSWYEENLEQMKAHGIDWQSLKSAIDGKD